MGIRRQRSTFFSVIVSTALLSACANNSAPLSLEEQASPNTGFELLEEQVGFMPAEKIKAGARAFVSSEQVRLRSAANEEDNIVGYVFINDEVEIIDPQLIGPNGYVVVRVIKSQSESTPLGTNVYLSSRFLNESPKAIDPAATNLNSAATAAPAPTLSGTATPPVNSGRLFVITNIATEKLRVYQRCLPSEKCVNRLIFEGGVVNGQDEDGNRTNAGYYRISTWHKFYETIGRYPAWYKPGYPDVPAPGNRSAWFDSAYMPNGQGDMRGAFGWYTAHVGPNPAGQWTHGTGGWGEDGTDFITFKDSFLGFFAKLFNVHVRSHGCTRIDNEAIAYLRTLLPVNTPLIKVYAQEDYRDGNRTLYSDRPARWNYIMTKRGNQKQDGNHQVADREIVLASRTPQSEWIEQGTYEVDQYPDASSEDIYGLGSSSMQGTFYVDDGTLVGYRHPSGIGVGGFAGLIAPEYVISKNSATVASAPARSKRRSSWSPYPEDEE